MTKHTPGPWEMTKLDTEPRKPDAYVLGRSLPHHWTGIGEVRLNGCEPGSEENAANARLIAAAPELLAACEGARALIRTIDAANPGGFAVGMMLLVLDKAIAKARGEPAEPRKGEYLIPAGARAGSCRSCGAPVLWITTAKGSAMPLSVATIEERDGERYALSHFADCPQGKGWSKK